MGDLLIPLLLILENIIFTNFIIICLEYFPHITWYMYEHVYKRPKENSYWLSQIVAINMRMLF